LKNKIKKDKLFLYSLILPSVALIFTFYILPNILNFYYSFTDWNAFSSEINLIGLYNFKALMQDQNVHSNILTTIKYAIMVAVIQNGVAFILALALEKTSKINGFFRTLFFIPVLFSSLAAGFIFKGVYAPEGPLNNFLSLITGREIDFPFLASITFTLFFVALVHSWRYMGIIMLVYIAGLNSVPEELIEAGRVEGASFMRIIKNIKIPLIGPAITYNVTTSLIGALSTLEIVLSVTKGGPAGSTDVLNYTILQNFGYGDYGYTVTISLILFIIICIFAFPLVIFLKKREVEL